MSQNFVVRELPGKYNVYKYTTYIVVKTVHVPVNIGESLGIITGYGSIGIAMVFVFSPYIWKFSSYLQFQVFLTLMYNTCQN